MATLNLIKPEQVLYSTSVRGSSFAPHCTLYYPVRVIEVDLPGRRVLASLNDNPPAWYAERNVSKWRVKKPE